MPGPLDRCARCARPTDDARALSGAFRWPAVFAMAFLHAGLWAGDLLASRLCRSCRAQAAALSLGVAVAVIGGAVILLSAARS